MAAWIGEVVMRSKWTDEQLTAHEELLAYQEHQKCMQYIEYQLERLETDHLGTVKSLNCDTVSIQRSHDPMRESSKQARYLDQKTELIRAHSESEDACLRIERALNQRLRCYPDHKRCLGYYYLFSLPLSEVGEVMNYSLSKVKDLRKEGLSLYFRG